MSGLANGLRSVYDGTPCFVLHSCRWSQNSLTPLFSGNNGGFPDLFALGREAVEVVKEGRSFQLCNCQMRETKADCTVGVALGIN